MTNFSSRATEQQIDAASQIERDITRLKELAAKADLRFLVYLMEMAHDEASVIAKGKKIEVEFVSTLLHKD